MFPLVLFVIHLNSLPVLVNCVSATRQYSPLPLSSAPQNGGPAERVAVAGRVLDSSWESLERHGDEGRRGPLSSTQGSHLHLATSSDLYSHQICL